MGVPEALGGPLAKGLLAGQYDASTQFTDPVREAWSSGQGRSDHLARLRKVEALRCLARAGRTPAQVALAFVLAQAGVTVAIPGAKSPGQARANAAAADLALSEADWKQARDLTA